MNTWCSTNDSGEVEEAADMITTSISRVSGNSDYSGALITYCLSCGHPIELYDQGRIHELPGLPAGVKFDPTDHEILEHLEAKAMEDGKRLHPLIDEFIKTREGDNGICSTHPEKLPDLSMKRSEKRWPNPPLFPPAFEGVHHRHPEAKKNPHGQKHVFKVETTNYSRLGIKACMGSNYRKIGITTTTTALFKVVVSPFLKTKLAQLN
ncbi:hypothetical protein CDL15_Pgr016811 [Punica granatum]|nr:hypothetical protein CDL15_Pgr016811 [Punica granatum]